jgi:hypothetical protein
VTVIADDGYGGADAGTFDWSVADVNRHPTLAAIGDRTVAEGDTLQVTGVGSDPDLPYDSLTYRLAAPPTGAAISNGGEITWSPTEAQGPAVVTFTVQVADAAGATAMRTFDVEVVESNTPPSLAPIPAHTNGAGDDVLIRPAATDADLPTNTLRFQASGRPLVLSSPPAAGSSAAPPPPSGCAHGGREGQ